MNPEEDTNTPTDHRQISNVKSTRQTNMRHSFLISITSPSSTLQISYHVKENRHCRIPPKRNEHRKHNPAETGLGFGDPRVTAVANGGEWLWEGLRDCGHCSWESYRDIVQEIPPSISMLWDLRCVPRRPIICVTRKPWYTICSPYTMYSWRQTIPNISAKDLGRPTLSLWHRARQGLWFVPWWLPTS